MKKYSYRSMNTGKESTTRIGACITEFADYFRSDAFDVPDALYPLLVIGAPLVVGELYVQSVMRGKPIRRIRRIQL